MPGNCAATPDSLHVCRRDDATATFPPELGHVKGWFFDALESGGAMRDRMPSAPRERHERLGKGAPMTGVEAMATPGTPTDEMAKNARIIAGTAIRIVTTANDLAVRGQGRKTKTPPTHH